MTVLLASTWALARYAAALDRLAASGGPRGPLECIDLAEGDDASALAPAEVERITIAFYSGDLLRRRPQAARFWAATQAAPHLQWLHTATVGLDSPVFGEFMARGVLVSNSAGATAEPIALSAIGGLLALARGFPAWAEAQRRHEWRIRPREEVPEDIRGQTLVVFGLGSIGGYIARFGRALGLHVVGVRRTPADEADGVDEWVPPERLAAVLPRAQWLAIAVPLTAQTRGAIDGPALAALPPGARVLNVARGTIVDEPALIEALRSGHLGGAYLDVFAREPLAPESPLWDLPNVIISPHDSASSRGNPGRADAIFVEELERWQRGETPRRVVADR